METIRLSVFGCLIGIECHDLHAVQLLEACYGQLSVSVANTKPDLEYQVGHDPVSNHFRISRTDCSEFLADSDSEFLFLFEKDMTIALQCLRSDLFFLHAAVVAYRGCSALISAPSGTGKSTLTYALLHAGFGYLSDELAPLELEKLQVLPYPHALCLKSIPPEPFQLPARTLNTGRTLHIPTVALPGETITTPRALTSMFFIRRDGFTDDVALEKLSKAEVAAHLYSNSLNALAHVGDGLDVAVGIAERIPGYAINSSNLPAATEAIRDALVK